MKYKLQISKKAKEDLISLDRVAQERIVLKLRFFMEAENPLVYAKKLKDFRLGSYRFRVGDYRVIFDLDSDGNICVLMILRIKHREDVCE